MVRTQIQLTEEQAIKVKKIAARRGVSMAEVIRDAVEGAIEPKHIQFQGIGTSGRSV